MGPARSILRGELETFSLSTLLTVLEMERRGGMLILERPRQLGRLAVRDGRVVRAQVEGRHRVSGKDAVFELLTWTEGQFELWHAEVGGPDEIRTSTAHLLMEGARRADEAAMRAEAARAKAALEGRTDDEERAALV